MLLNTRDLFFKIRHLSTPLPEAARDIVLIAIDEESCQRMEARWPWSRKLFAELIEELRRYAVKSVGLNVSFTGLENQDEQTTLLLAQAIRDQGRVVVGATFGQGGRLIPPTPLVANAVQDVGYLEKIVDSDYTIRRSYLLRLYQSRLDSSSEPSFPLALYTQSLEEGQGRLQFDSSLGFVSHPGSGRGFFINTDGSYTINYFAHDDDFLRVPAWKIFNRAVSPNDLRGKTAIVGVTASVFGDTHPTPLGLLPGIAIHANEWVALKSGRLLHFLPDQVTFFASWLAGLIVLAFFMFRKFWAGIIAGTALAFTFFLGAQAAFAKDLLIEPLVLLIGPLSATGLGAFINWLRLLLEKRGLETRVIHDKMTGLYTYDFLRIRLEDEWKRCQQSKLPVSLVMTDLDRFKSINDTLGHEVGNDMIRRAAGVIKESVRGYDIVSRYGGDEFVILLWHSGREDAMAYKERLRSLYQAMAQKLDGTLKESTISIGTATFDPNTDPKNPPSPQALIEEADKNLFEDKQSRRKTGR